MSDSNYSYMGTINDLLGIDSNYNNKLIVQEGNLVYVSDKVSSQEEKWFEKLGIEKASDYFTVEFDTGVDATIASQTIKINNTAMQPADPTNGDFEFIGWYYVVKGGTEGNPTYTEKAFDFDTQITQDYSLYAKYKNEAILKDRNDTAFWQDKYRTKITSVAFKKAEINVPLTALDSWDVKADNNCSEVRAYIEDDGSGNETYKLTIVSPYTIYLNARGTGYFENFSKLKSIDFSNFNTSKTKSMVAMFLDCTSLEIFDLRKFDTSKVTNMMYMFKNCQAVTSFDLTSFDTSKTTNMHQMFCLCYNVENIYWDADKFNTENVTTMESMFSSCRKLKNIDTSKFNTANVTNMKSLFSNCLELTAFDITSFNTEKVFYMNEMFYNCSKLESLDLSNFDTTNVRYINGMFNGCSKLSSLDLSNFNTSKVTTMRYMFYNCQSLENLNIESFDTKNVTNMGYMFENCYKLNNLNLSNFNTENVTTMERMFCVCGVENLDISSFNTPKVENFYSMFYTCKAIKNINLTNFTISDTANCSKMFQVSSFTPTIYVKDESTARKLYNSNTNAIIYYGTEDNWTKYTV